ncbi:hypothetical protein DL96DRAFT_1766282, partial [Flagelloscypha sp. PMI_526]
LLSSKSFVAFHHIPPQSSFSVFQYRKAGQSLSEAAMEVPHSTKASTFHSTQAQFTELSTKIRDDLEKVKLELNQASFVAPEILVKDFIDKLSRTIEMHNLLITPHLPADTKIRLNGLQKTAERSAELLQDVTNLSRKYANKIIEQAMRAHLYEENITFRNGAIASYHADSVHPQLPPTPTLSRFTGMTALLQWTLSTAHIIQPHPHPIRPTDVKTSSPGGIPKPVIRETIPTAENDALINLDEDVSPPERKTIPSRHISLLLNDFSELRNGYFTSLFSLSLFLFLFAMPWTLTDITPFLMVLLFYHILFFIYPTFA